MMNHHHVNIHFAPAGNGGKMTCKPKVKVQKKSMKAGDGGSFFRCEKLTPEKQGPFKRGYGTQSPTLSVSQSSGHGQYQRVQGFA